MEKLHDNNDIIIADEDLVIESLRRHGLGRVFDDVSFGFGYKLKYITKVRLSLVYGLNFISDNILSYVISMIDKYVEGCKDGQVKLVNVIEFKKFVFSQIKGYCSVCCFDFDEEDLGHLVVDYLFRMFVKYDYVQGQDFISNVEFLGDTAELVGFTQDERDKGFCFISEREDEVDTQLRNIYIKDCRNCILWNIYEVSRALDVDVKYIEDEIISKYDENDFSRLMYKLKKMNVDLKSNKNMPEDIKQHMKEYNDSIGVIFNMGDTIKVNDKKRRKRNFIRKYSSTGELLDTYYSIKEAVNKNEGYTKTGISQCINGNRKTYKGFVWKKD